MNPIKVMAYVMLGVLAVSVGPQASLQGQSCGTCGQSCESAPVCPTRMYGPGTANHHRILPENGHLLSAGDPPANDHRLPRRADHQDR